MRGRIWLFAALVAAALAVHFAMLSSKVAQAGEDNVHAHLALSSSALRAELDLIDARLAPRLLSLVPELVEATRAPTDAAEAQPKPDERALRAASSAISPEPDLVAVVNKQGAIVSRKDKGTQVLDDSGRLPLARAALEANPAPAFGVFDGSVYRLSAAHIPGNPAGALVGTLVDDRFAAQLKTQVDADVTLVQGGKVLASSLPPDARAQVVRWTLAPSAGFGELKVRLPFVGDRLSGKLPVRASKLAARGALLPLDSGVQAAITVPAEPYLGWLARYQAYYAVAFALFLLFSLVWGLSARAPVPAPAPVAALPVDEGVGPVKRHPRHGPLVGTDVGEGRTAPPPTDDVPWHAPEAEAPSVVVAPDLHTAEPVVEAEPVPEAAEEWEAPAAAHAVESLDPEFPAGNGASLDPDLPPAEDDPFTHPPQAVSAEEVGLVEAEPMMAPPPPPSDASGEFSFAGLLDEAHRTGRIEIAKPSVPAGLAPEPAVALEEPEPAAAEPEEAAPAAAAEPAAEEQAEPFPGDEPTRIEPVSAALLDKLRERDEELSQRASAQAHREPEPAAESAEPAEPPPTDPDEPHWRETYDKFRALKTRLGEPADRISFEKFASKLRKNREDLVAKHNCKGVRFSVYEKDGKAAIKASAIR